MTPAEFLTHPNLYLVDTKERPNQILKDSFDKDGSIVMAKVWFAFNALEDKIYGLIEETNLPLWPKPTDFKKVMESRNILLGCDWHESTKMPKPHRQIVIEFDQACGFKPSVLITNQQTKYAHNVTVHVDYYLNKNELFKNPENLGEILYDTNTINNTE